MVRDFSCFSRALCVHKRMYTKPCACLSGCERRRKSAHQLQMLVTFLLDLSLTDARHGMCGSYVLKSPWVRDRATLIEFRLALLFPTSVVRVFGASTSTQKLRLPTARMWQLGC